MSSSTLTLRKHPSFQSEFLPDSRDLTVYLPPGYDNDASRRFPVLYLHDGQNLFEPDKAFKKGEHWRAGETAAELIETHQIEPLIIVGIDNTGPRRIHEYTHTHDRRRGGGEARAYGQFIIKELKPFIDATYRSLPDPLNTGMGGSSLGALVTLYLGLEHPDVFSKLAVMSPSVWWDRRAILRNVREARPKPRVRLWLDMGTREGRYHVDNARLLKAGLLSAGWIEGEDLHYEEIPGGTHSEEAWAERFGRVLKWLF